MKRNINIKTLSLASMFLALALVMPFLTGQIPQIGSMLCPMLMRLRISECFSQMQHHLRRI